MKLNDVAFHKQQPTQNRIAQSTASQYKNLEAKFALSVSLDSTFGIDKIVFKMIQEVHRKLVQVTKNKNGVTQISMSRSPVNALNFQLLHDLREALIDAEKNGSTGVILTSTIPKVFSAGLDLVALHNPDENYCERFWTMLQDTWLTLTSLSIPTAAAINGACPAGGCALAMICEYRVMVDGKATIGLNETQLGTVAPLWLMTSMVDLIGLHQAEMAILRGKMFTTQEALKVGLVDDLATDKEQAISKCLDYIASYATISGPARASSKLMLRAERIEWMKKNRNADMVHFINKITSPETQANLGMYIQILQSRSKL